MTMNKTMRMGRRAMLKGCGAVLAGSAMLLKSPLDIMAAPQTMPMHTQTRVLLGTFVTISVSHPSKNLADEAMGQAFAEVKRLEAELTRHDSASPLATLNSSGKLYDAPLSLIHVLNRAERIYKLSNGAFDVTVAPLLGLYRQEQNPKGKMQIDAKQLQDVKKLVQADELFVTHDHVRLGRSGMAITLDGIAKGHIADMASAVLAKHGAVNHLVNAGGDIRSLGQKNIDTPWRVGIENPNRDGSTVASINLYGAIATSGSYEMFYDAKREHHHIINPKLKQSPQHTLSVTVTAPTALEADALATALSVLPVRAALELVNSLPQRECLLINNQGQKIASRGWNA